MLIDMADREYLRRVLEAPLSYVFGRDVFVSYSRRDAAAYAPALVLRLKDESPKLSFYLDQWSAPPGRRLPRALRRHVRWSRLLVVIITDGALCSGAVHQEIALYPTSRRNVVPVLVGEASTEIPWTEEPWCRIHGVQPEIETVEALRAASPNAHVISRITQSISFVTQDRRLKRAVWKFMIEDTRAMPFR